LWLLLAELSTSVVAIKMRHVDDPAQSRFKRLAGSIPDWRLSLMWLPRSAAPFYRRRTLQAESPMAHTSARHIVTGIHTPAEPVGGIIVWETEI